MAHRASGPTDYRGSQLAEGGSVHLVNVAGDIINPASQEDVVDAATSTTARLDLGNELLQAVVE